MFYNQVNTYEVAETKRIIIVLDTTICFIIPYIYFKQFYWVKRYHVTWINSVVFHSIARKDE